MSGPVPAELRAILTMCAALEEAGLLADDPDDPEGRERALAVLEALLARDVVLYPVPRAAPPPAEPLIALDDEPPPLSEQLGALALRLRAAGRRARHGLVALRRRRLSPSFRPRGGAARARPADRP